MYKVDKIAIVVLEKGKELSKEERRTLYSKGYYVEEIKYYVAKQLKVPDKEKLRTANLIVLIYNKKISTFGIKAMKYSALFAKKIIVKQNIESTDL